MKIFLASPEFTPSFSLPLEGGGLCEQRLDASEASRWPLCWPKASFANLRPVGTLRLSSVPLAPVRRQRRRSAVLWTADSHEYEESHSET